MSRACQKKISNLLIIKYSLTSTLLSNNQQLYNVGVGIDDVHSAPLMGCQRREQHARRASREKVE